MLLPSLVIFLSLRNENLRNKNHILVVTLRASYSSLRNFRDSVLTATGSKVLAVDDYPSLGEEEDRICSRVQPFFAERGSSNFFFRFD